MRVERGNGGSERPVLEIERQQNAPKSSERSILNIALYVPISRAEVTELPPVITLHRTGLSPSGSKRVEAGHTRPPGWDTDYPAD